MFILRLLNIFGIFAYILMVAMGSEMIQFFDITNPTTVLSYMSLLGGLILVSFPFVDVLILAYKVWTGNIKLNDE